MISSVTAVILTFFGGVLCIAGVKGNPVITANPSEYIPKENFTLRCVFDGPSEGITDIISITLGKSGRNSFAMAGVSDIEGTLVSHKIKERASASGFLNHTHFRESYIDLYLNETTCSDLGNYYCSMAVIDEIIIHAVKSEFKFSLKEGESCLQIDTSSGQERAFRRPGIFWPTCVFISGLLRMRDW